ncbi:MAG TPA: CAP domain-containing protein [Polyangiaceae bacterium]|nr:CAP domain-containing protein [Polyangiaceae bacterium]
MLRSAGLLCAVFVTISLFSCGPRKGAGPAGPRPKGPLALDEARLYVLELINRDRAEEGLEPVELDDTATEAGQRHSDDMAHHGFTAHLGTDGSVPEQRYSEAGGTDMAQENAACFFDAVERPLDPEPMFLPEELEKIEYAFISEVPPNDGHRRNILKAIHNKVGIGLSKPKDVKEVCMAQEFVDDYGDYGKLPKKAKVGQVIEVEGELREPMHFGGVGLARIDHAKPITPEALNGTGGYTFPSPFVVYFPAGYKTPKPVEVDGKRFRIEIPLTDKGRPGRYEVNILAAPDAKAKAFEPIAITTIDVR